MSRSGGGGVKMRASQRDSNLRGRSGKVNPAGGRIRGATGAINRRGRVLNAITFELCKKIVVKFYKLIGMYKIEQMH